jgi:hypothetical protein
MPQLGASLEQQGRIVPANESLANRAGEASLRSSEDIQKSRIDRATTRPTGEGWS